MYIIAINHGIFGMESKELHYLGWQEPAWDEDGYFWTSRECIIEVLKIGNNTKEHPFLFDTKGEAKKFAKRLKLADYVIEQWK